VQTNLVVSSTLRGGIVVGFWHLGLLAFSGELQENSVVSSGGK
jgi:hypothetical protein